jgi:hypothetical protein
VATDVRVRLCTLTIRRTEGWSWGPGPEPYIQAALAGVEAAIEAAITEAGIGPGDDVRLEEPVQLEIGGDGSVTTASRTALVERLVARAATARGTEVVAREGTEVSVREAGGLPAAPSPGDAAIDEAAGALARTLGRWSRAGRTARIVGGWPAELVRTWVDAIADAARRPGARGERAPASLSAEAVALIAESVLGSEPAGRSGREAADRVLILLAAIIATLGDRLPDAETQALAWERVAAGAEAPAARRPGTALASVGAALQRAEAGEAGRPEAPSLPDVVPALPLLVLAQLAQIGFVDAMVAAAAAAGLPGGAAALGAAVAGKVLPPPGHGWRREPVEAAAVAYAFGGPATQVDEELAALAAHASSLAAPLASALQAAYAESRSANDAVLVWTGEPGTLCGEQEGLLPAAWVADEGELRAALNALGRPPVRHGAAFAALAHDLHERRAIPRADAPALERALGAAAGTALGLIGLHLSGLSGPPTPLLALERLADLEGRVHASPEGLVLSIPRGQRWLDLGRARLLELFHVPWLPAGRLEVGSW